MGKFDGTVFLELGTNIASVDIVKYAKSEGAYVIVTDYLPIEKSEAKQYADETAMISTLDVEALIRFAQEKKVNGIFCGVSEANLLSAMRVAEKMHLPCYFTEKNWNAVQSKKEFKDFCIRNEISVAQRYSEEQLISGDISYPVIVKPVNSGGSLGVSICYDKKELEQAVKLANSYSRTGDSIIEEYICKNEVMVYYTVMNGEIILSAMCDRIMKVFEKHITQIPVGYIFPSKYLDLYQSKYDLPMRNLIKNLGIDNGLISFQSFIDNDTFIPFDPSYRLDGTTAFHFVEHENGVNVMKQLVDFSLLNSMGNIDKLIERENPYFKSKCLEVPILLTRGKITRIEGIEKVIGLKEVIYLSKIHKIGDILTEKVHFTQMLCRILICAKDMGQLSEVLEIIRKNVRVYDENGNRMDYEVPFFDFEVSE